MSERKPVEGVGATDPAARPRAAERIVAETRSREARVEKEPDPPPPPLEPSPSHRPYRVHLDPETSRLFTEVLDPRTGGVLLRIPPGYSPSEAAEAPTPHLSDPVELKL